MKMNINVELKSLLEALIIVAEKGAQIARIARKHCASEKVQEKIEGEANPRYQQDFKTLADVLVQETVRHDLVKKFPSLKNCVLGEETNTFCNADGETVCIKIKKTELGTAKILAKLIENKCAKELARAAHTRYKPTVLATVQYLPEKCPRINMENIGIWIDPIDCTAEFIKGEWGEGPSDIYNQSVGKDMGGLPCVTVLVGAFLRNTGEPILGVINQPFYAVHLTRCVWGVCYEGIHCSNIYVPTESESENEYEADSETDTETEIEAATEVEAATEIEVDINMEAEYKHNILLSGSETSVDVYRLMKAGFKTAHPPGAGFKLLMVAIGSSDAYILSGDTSFRWDTCGPHAVLRALGGDIVTFSPPHLPLLYHTAADNQHEEGCMRFANRGGVIAYRTVETFDRIKEALYEVTCSDSRDSLAVEPSERQDALQEEADSLDDCETTLDDESQNLQQQELLESLIQATDEALKFTPRRATRETLIQTIEQTLKGDISDTQRELYEEELQKLLQQKQHSQEEILQNSQKEIMQLSEDIPQHSQEEVIQIEQQEPLEDMQPKALQDMQEENLHYMQQDTLQDYTQDSLQDEKQKLLEDDKQILLLDKEQEPLQDDKQTLQDENIMPLQDEEISRDDKQKSLQYEK